MDVAEELSSLNETLAVLQARIRHVEKRKSFLELKERDTKRLCVPPLIRSSPVPMWLPEPDDQPEETIELGDGLVVFKDTVHLQDFEQFFTHGDQSMYDQYLSRHLVCLESFVMQKYGIGSVVAHTRGLQWETFRMPGRLRYKIRRSDATIWKSNRCVGTLFDLHVNFEVLIGRK